MQTVVKASCTRRVGKDVFSTIDEITREYFEVGFLNNINYMIE